jgi:hypothetical protein
MLDPSYGYLLLDASQNRGVVEVEYICIKSSDPENASFVADDMRMGVALAEYVMMSLGLLCVVDPYGVLNKAAFLMASNG